MRYSKYFVKFEPNFPIHNRFPRIVIPSVASCAPRSSVRRIRLALLICCQSREGVHEQEITMSASRPPPIAPPPCHPLCHAGSRRWLHYAERAEQEICRRRGWFPQLIFAYFLPCPKVWDGTRMRGRDGRTPVRRLPIANA